MASPQRLTATLRSVSPLSGRNNSQIRRFLSPKTPTKDVASRDAQNENLLSPFNIDTPNRRKILNDGLPSKHRTVLGTGGFGTVYKASYKGTTASFTTDYRCTASIGDEVAAKIMERRRCSEAVMNSEKRASFLRHANIVRVLTIEQGASLSLITMELCGTTLQDHLVEYAVPRDVRVRILRDISGALEFCHAAGIVHADVKPANILMSENGQAKLTDFGSSVLTDEPFETVELHGTPGYAAPEVLRGSIPTTAADIYSLGVVAWQMLSRKLPFAGLHTHTIIYLSAKGSRPSDSSLEDECGGRYKRLYRQMWSQNIVDRPKICEAVDRINTLIIQ